MVGRKWFTEVLLCLASLLQHQSSTSVSAVLHQASPIQSTKSTVYLNKPSIQDAAIVQKPGHPVVPKALGDHRRLITDTSDPRQPFDNWELEDYVLVATIEGSLYALDRYSGATKWVLEGERPAVSALLSTPLETHVNATAEDPLKSEEQPRWIVQPVEGGQLFLFDSELGVIELPLTIRQLIDHGAFRIPGDDKVYTGKKETQFVAVDSKTGKILSRYGSPSTSFSSGRCFSPKDSMDELEDECDASVDGRDVLMIGRTVYHLTIASSDGTTWDVTYSEWSPNMIDSHLADQYLKVQDDLYICPSAEGLVYMHSPSRDSALWMKLLGSSAITAFDVFRPAFQDPSTFGTSPSLVLVRQPPSPFFSSPTSEIMTFLNTTEEGAWYALSTDRFPLLTSRVRPAPWVVRNHGSVGERNATKADLVGFHPVARTLDVSIENPSLLPAPNMPGLIEGGDWNRSSQFRPLKDNPMFLLVGFLVVFLAVWRKRFSHRRQLRRAARSFAMAQQVLQEALDKDVKEAEKTDIDPVQDETSSNHVVNDNKAEAAEEGENGPPAEKKPRRKRGQRGGKNNKKKVGFAGTTTEGDDDEHDENNEITSPLPKDPAQDMPLNDQGNYTIDGLTVTDKLLGSGSQGTFVYEGVWEGVRVAVKRMQIENFEIAEKEVDHLRESDEHPNIVRYYTSKRSDKFIYIALELCPATLEQVIIHGDKEPFCHLAGPNLQKQYTLSQIASGLHFLHSLKIVHRDLKPQNILVAPPKLRTLPTGSPLWRHYKQDQTRCLISDFGLCKKLEPDHSTFQAASTMAAGTSGWRAPEVLRGVETNKTELRDNSSLITDTTPPIPGSDRKITRAVDIFSMGCLFYYILTDGEHPFGGLTYLRDGRIMDNQYDLSALDCSTNDGVEARDLIEKMISPNPNERPNAAKVLEHPYFWDEKRRTDFILEFSDRLNQEPRDPPSLIVQRVESAAPEICGKDWTRQLDAEFMKDSRVNRSYDGTKINDLIRLVRNKKNHNHDLPEQLRKKLNEFQPGGYIGYFLYKRFPKLLLHLYNVCEDEGLGIAQEAWYLSFWKNM